MVEETLVNNNSSLYGDDDEDSFFREIKEISRGRPKTRDEISINDRSRLSRWDSTPSMDSSPFSSIFKTLPPGLTDEQISALILRLRIDEITKKVTIGPIEITDRDRDRSPSPPPIYDSNGKRSNTREQRIKDKLQKERHHLIVTAQRISPTYKPPSDYQPPNEKKIRKIYIPIKDHPEYNFIGLIIGPRGNTQKRMEKESGAKIAIRGKGSSRDGKSTKIQFQENDELHVLLTADTTDQLDKAEVLVREFLVPVEEGKNEHKRQQLRELAEMNGTLRERPAYMGNRSWTPVDIKCSHCGETTHPSSDCPLRTNESNQQYIETEYQKFIDEMSNALGFDINQSNVEPPPQQQNNNGYDQGHYNRNSNENLGDMDESPPHHQQQYQGSNQPPYQQQWSNNNNGYNNNYSNNSQQQQQPFYNNQNSSPYGPPRNY
ncbi:hypothetical protein DICPUDRAFT_148524 [Dictyostelium purpureum]|uniref:Branchpoint-bridging protein n=1 Tax=Dictyostelium purpureum TaxID=5786 RepID=F0ZBC2_DICPU|nr:uncharacterized protein DICPUDRAFT_148524 [Dictyostelium purpureum]EGC38748.1 hypothetical protein DICPUDRAFT_148524 [Dictyostelium purpureum]|eukprot:XP_003284739.1 hypothetical protein DICPUDRAFT_148524 [Dictyostelium purpureum]